MRIEEALKASKERGLDLIQITDKVSPPICKIMDLGKYLYIQEKKKKKSKKSGILKEIRIGFNISPHDLETKANLAEKFLNKGNKLKIDMRLRGREKALKNHATEKINNFLEMIKEKVPIKIEKQLKKKGGNLNVIIYKG